MNRTKRTDRRWVNVAIPVVALHVVAVSLLVAAITSASSRILLGLAIAAYTRGLVHAMDFDHIAMIDTSIRKFLGDGRPTRSVGLAFSLGHSTIVIIAAALVIGGSQLVRVGFDENSSTATVLGIIGATASATYLLLAALANAASLQRLVRLWRERGAGASVSQGRRAQLGPRGRVLSKPMSRIREPWHVYCAGLLFSLGFDTSSQIGLLVLTGVAAVQGAWGWLLLCLPLLFTAGMSLGDGLNGVIMGRVYEAAQPQTQLRANIALTSISVVAAAAVTLTVGAGLLDELGVGGSVTAWIAGIDTRWAGVGIVVVLLLAAAVTLRPAAATRRRPQVG